MSKQYAIYLDEKLVQPMVELAAQEELRNVVSGGMNYWKDKIHPFEKRLSSQLLYLKEKNKAEQEGTDFVGSTSE